MNTAPKPAWRELYLQGAVGVTLLFLVPLLNLSEDMQKVAFFSIGAALCVAMRLWISDNRYALEAEELDDIQMRSGRYYTLNPGASSIHESSADTSMNDGEKEVA
jgi:hypothetical protein